MILGDTLIGSDIPSIEIKGSEIKVGGSPVNTNDRAFFDRFISVLDGWNSKCKNLHWAAPACTGDSIHVRLDEFNDVISGYKDLLAETSMGVCGDMGPCAIKQVESRTCTPQEFISEVKQVTLNFYGQICDCPEMAGIKSDCEQFISSIDKYTYLFRKCNQGGAML